jgi:hypothetical protein
MRPKTRTNIFTTNVSVLKRPIMALEEDVPLGTPDIGLPNGVKVLVTPLLCPVHLLRSPVIQVGGAYVGDMHTEVAVDAAAVVADEHAFAYAGPARSWKSNAVCTEKRAC